MKGQYKNGKIVHISKPVNYLYGGDWEHGWSGVRTTFPENVEYDVLETAQELVDGEYYDFDLIEDFKGKKIAFIKNK